MLGPHNLCSTTQGSSTVKIVSSLFSSYNDTLGLCLIYCTLPSLAAHLLSVVFCVDSGWFSCLLPVRTSRSISPALVNWWLGNSDLISFTESQCYCWLCLDSPVMDQGCLIKCQQPADSSRLHLTSLSLLMMSSFIVKFINLCCQIC